MTEERYVPRGHEHERGVLCPYCRVTIGALEVRWECPICRTAHHRECVDEHGRCTVLGCTGTTWAGSPGGEGAAPSVGAAILARFRVWQAQDAARRARERRVEVSEAVARDVGGHGTRSPPSENWLRLAAGAVMTILLAWILVLAGIYAMVRLNDNVSRRRHEVEAKAYRAWRRRVDEAQQEADAQRRAELRREEWEERQRELERRERGLRELEEIRRADARRAEEEAEELREHVKPWVVKAWRPVHMPGGWLDSAVLGPDGLSTPVSSFEAPDTSSVPFRAKRVSGKSALRRWTMSTA